jgi:hypothetical protein
MAITSQMRASATFGEVVIDDWQAAGLLKPSVVKPVITNHRHSRIDGTSRAKAKATHRLRHPQREIAAKTTTLAQGGR